MFAIIKSGFGSRPTMDFTTVQALGAALQHELPEEFHDVMRDLERARMEREDFLQGNIPDR